MKNEGGREEHSYSAKVWHSGDEGYMKFERVVCVLKISFRFRLLQLYE